MDLKKLWMCEYECGYQGTHQDCVEHEKTCPMKSVKVGGKKSLVRRQSSCEADTEDIGHEILHQGFVEKKSSIWGGWLKRYLILTKSDISVWKIKSKGAQKKAKGNSRAPKGQPMGTMGNPRGAQVHTRTHKRVHKGPMFRCPMGHPEVRSEWKFSKEPNNSKHHHDGPMYIQLPLLRPARSHHIMRVKILIIW